MLAVVSLGPSTAPFAANVGQVSHSANQGGDLRHPWSAVPCNGTIDISKISQQHKKRNQVGRDKRGGLTETLQH